MAQFSETPCGPNTSHPPAQGRSPSCGCTNQRAWVLSSFRELARPLRISGSKNPQWRAQKTDSQLTTLAASWDLGARGLPACFLFPPLPSVHLTLSFLPPSPSLSVICLSLSLSISCSLSVHLQVAAFHLHPPVSLLCVGLSLSTSTDLSVSLRLYICVSPSLSVSLCHSVSAYTSLCLSISPCLSPSLS